MKKQIGFALVPGFRNADVMALEAILTFHPGNKIHYIAEKNGFVEGVSGYGFKSTCTFADAPQLDVLVIPELSDSGVSDPALQKFIQAQYQACTFVVGISSGVIALAKSGMINGKTVTADRSSLESLKTFDLTPVDKKSFVKDQKLITAGPSTSAFEAGYYVMSQLRGKALTKMLELNLEYNPTVCFDDIRQTELPQPGRAPLNIAVITPPNPYFPDVAGAIDVFSRLPGAKIHYVWKDKGEKKTILGPTIRSTMTFKECPQMDVLVVGAITPNATVDEDLIAFYKKQAPGAKAVVGVCAGVFVAGAASLLENRMSVTNFHMLGMLKNVGGHRHNTETISDGKYHTAGPAIGSYEIALQVVAQLMGRETAAYLEGHCLEYRPQPLFNMGTPRLAGKVRYGLSKLISTPLVVLYNPKVKRMYRKNRLNKTVQGKAAPAGLMG